MTDTTSAGSAAILTFRPSLPTPYVGHYQIGGPTGLSIKLCKRPSWIARLFTRWLLEWVWVDNG